MKCISLYSKIE